MRKIWLLALPVLATAPAAANAQADGMQQSWSDFQTQMAMDSARTKGLDANMRGGWKRSGSARRSDSVVSSQAKQMCANKSAYRSRFGAGDPRVVKLNGLCRQAGL